MLPCNSAHWNSLAPAAFCIKAFNELSNLNNKFVCIFEGLFHCQVFINAELS